MDGPPVGGPDATLPDGTSGASVMDGAVEPVPDAAISDVPPGVVAVDAGPDGAPDSPILDGPLPQPDAASDLLPALVCPTGTELCAEACVRTASDPNHCGECGHVCNGETVCYESSCQRCSDTLQPAASSDGPADAYFGIAVDGVILGRKLGVMLQGRGDEHPVDRIFVNVREKCRACRDGWSQRQEHQAGAIDGLEEELLDWNWQRDTPLLRKPRDRRIPTPRQ